MVLRLNIPHFRTADVVAIANVPQDTIDQWVTLGHLSLDARPHGRETGLYTGSDVLKICAAAELSRWALRRPAARLAELLRMAPSALRSASPQAPNSERRRIDNISAKNFDYGTSAP